MIDKFWKIMDRFFLLLIEVTGENEMGPDKIPTTVPFAGNKTT